MELNRFKQLLESSLGNSKPLINESTVVTSPNEDEWCKKNVKDTTKQICIVKTPNSGDQSTCQKMTGSVARQEGYPTHIMSDVSKENFCKSVWEKTLVNEQENTLRVKITKVTKPTSWYKNLMGKEFTVYSDVVIDDFYEVIFSDEDKKSIPNADRLHVIKISDCEVVK